MKINLKKVDWIYIGVLGLGLVARIAESAYEKKRFDENLNEQYIDHFDDRVSKIVDEKIKLLK